MAASLPVSPGNLPSTPGVPFQDEPDKAEGDMRRVIDAKRVFAVPLLSGTAFSPPLV
jgi:hypothetical protein